MFRFAVATTLMFVQFFLHFISWQAATTLCTRYACQWCNAPSLPLRRLLQTNSSEPIFGKQLNIFVPKIPETQGHGIFQPRTGHNQAIFQWMAQTHMFFLSQKPYPRTTCFQSSRNLMEIAHRKQMGGSM